MDVPGTSSMDTYAQWAHAVECPICYSLYDKPMQMSCGHTLCASCIGQLVDQVRRNPDENAQQRINLAILEQNGAAIGLGGFIDQMDDPQQQQQFLDLPPRMDQLRGMVAIPPRRSSGTTIKCPECRTPTFVPTEGLPVNYRVQEIVSKVMPLYKDRHLIKHCNQCQEALTQGIYFNCTQCTENCTKLCSTCIVRSHNGHKMEEVKVLTSKDVQEMKAKIEKFAQEAFQALEEVKPRLADIGGSIEAETMQKLTEFSKVFATMIEKFDSTIEEHTTAAELEVEVNKAAKVSELFKGSLKRLNDGLFAAIKEAVKKFWDPFEKTGMEIGHVPPKQEPIAAVDEQPDLQAQEMAAGEAAAIAAAQAVIQPIQRRPNDMVMRNNPRQAVVHFGNVQRQRQRQRIQPAPAQVHHIMHLQQMMMHNIHQQPGPPPPRAAPLPHPPQRGPMQQQMMHHHPMPPPPPHPMQQGPMGHPQMQQQMQMNMFPMQQQMQQQQAPPPPPQHHRMMNMQQQQQQYNQMMNQQHLQQRQIPMNMPPQMMNHQMPRHPADPMMGQMQQQHQQHQQQQQQPPRMPQYAAPPVLNIQQQQQQPPRMVDQVPQMPQMMPRAQPVQQQQVQAVVPDEMPQPPWAQQLDDAIQVVQPQFAFNDGEIVQEHDEPEAEQEDPEEPVQRLNPEIDAFRVANANLQEYHEMRDRMHVGELQVEEVPDEEDEPAAENEEIVVVADAADFAQFQEMRQEVDAIEVEAFDEVVEQVEQQHEFIEIYNEVVENQEAEILEAQEVQNEHQGVVIEEIVVEEEEDVQQQQQNPNPPRRSEMRRTTRSATRNAAQQDEPSTSGTRSPSPGNVPKRRRVERRPIVEEPEEMDEGNDEVQVDNRPPKRRAATSSAQGASSSNGAARRPARS